LNHPFAKHYDVVETYNSFSPQVSVSHIIMQNQAEASIPTMVASGDASMIQHRTVTVRRKAAKRSERWYQDIAAPLPPSPQAEDIPARKEEARIKEEPLPPSSQSEDVPVRKKPRVQAELLLIKEEPLLPLRRSSRRVNATSGTRESTSAPDPPPPNATVVARQTKLPRIETSDEQLDDDDTGANPNDDDAAAALSRPS
jgi:hypothetical protein